jgi:hypothetical protein
LLFLGERGVVVKEDTFVDVSVLLIFFTRHRQFAEVFEQVKKARPRRLFLYQDGPRENHPEDMENIMKCRKIAENIDWECEVHKFYQEKNVGVDPSGYIADRWAFSMTDKCIVLEDDVVPSVSFFQFCKEMLDKYENDERIMLISGINSEEISPNVKEDYFFTSTTYTWGWASWARVVKNWEGDYSFLDDKKRIEKIENYAEKKHMVKGIINICAAERRKGIPRFETILIANQWEKNGLSITPTKNMINNIGLAGDSAHYASDIRFVPRGFRRIFTMNRYELDMDNIKMPTDVKDNEGYKKRTYRIYGWRHPMVKIWRTIEVLFYRICAGDAKGAVSDLSQKFDSLRKSLLG